MAVFNVHGIVYVNEDGTWMSFLFDCLTKHLFSSEHLAPIEREIRKIAIDLKSVKDETRVHRHIGTDASQYSRIHQLAGQVVGPCYRPFFFSVFVAGKFIT